MFWSIASDFGCAATPMAFGPTLTTLVARLTRYGNTPCADICGPRWYKLPILMSRVCSGFSETVSGTCWSWPRIFSLTRFFALTLGFWSQCVDLSVTTLIFPSTFMVMIRVSWSCWRVASKGVVVVGGSFANLAEWWLEYRGVRELQDWTDCQYVRLSNGYWTYEVIESLLPRLTRKFMKIKAVYLKNGSRSASCWVRA